MQFALWQILLFLPLSLLTRLKTTCFCEQWFVYIRDGFVSLSHIDTASISVMITKLLIEAHAKAFQTHDETAHNTVAIPAFRSQSSWSQEWDHL